MALVTKQSSDDLTLDKLHILLHGVPGSRKTFSAATLSKYYPEEGIPAKKKVDLKDMIWWGFDGGATRGFAEWGLNVPHVFDLSKVPVPQLGQAIVEAQKETLSIIKKNPDEDFWLVLDTISQLDVKYNVALEMQMAKMHADKGTKPNPEADRWAIFRGVLASHDRFFAATSTMPCNVIWLSHSRAVNPDANDFANTKAKAVNLPGYANIEIAVTGAAKDRYRRDMDIYGAIVPGKEGSSIYPDGGAGFEGRSRLTRFLEKKEPADFRVIMDKVKKGLAIANGE